MKKAEVKVGHYYAIHHSSDGPKRLSIIRIDGESIHGGWNATRIKTGRTIRIKAATKLRCEVGLNPAWQKDDTTGQLKWVRIEEREAMLRGEPVFRHGRRYRLTILPAGAKTRTITFEANFLGAMPHNPGYWEFDCRPESGTQQISAAGLREWEDIGKAVYAR